MDQSTNYRQLGYDQYFRFIDPTNNRVSSVTWDSQTEDGSVFEQKIANGSITDAKIKNMSADKITASTLVAPVNVGDGESGAFVKLDGPNNRLLVNDGVTNRIIVGKVG